MYIEANLTFRTYRPRKLKKGMLFYVAGNDNCFLMELDKTPPRKEQEATLLALGYPVLPYIVNDKAQVLAKPAQIAYLDYGGWELSELKVGHLNEIISDYNSKILLEMEDDKIVLYGHSVVLKYPETNLIEQL
jgi:hypothetical protein